MIGLFFCDNFLGDGRIEELFHFIVRGFLDEIVPVRKVRERSGKKVEDGDGRLLLGEGRGWLTTAMELEGVAEIRDRFGRDCDMKFLNCDEARDGK